MYGVKIPNWFYGLVGLVLIVLATAGIFYHKGKTVVQKDWDASIERGNTLLAELKGKRDVITITADVQYVDKVRVIREKGDTIIEQVPIFVPADSPLFSGGFRVYHDAASGNTLPGASRIFDAAPVEATTVAATVAENYKRCHLNAAELYGLQGWVLQQQQLRVTSP